MMETIRSFWMRLKKQLGRKDNYKKLEKQLKESGESQLSVSDPESVR